MNKFKQALQLMNKKGQRISGDILEMAIAGIVLVIAVVIMVTLRGTTTDANATAVANNVISGFNQAATFFVIIGLMVGAGYVLNKIFGIFSGAGR